MKTLGSGFFRSQKSLSRLGTLDIDEIIESPLSPNEPKSMKNIFD